jgi:hypothetical protein
MHATQPVEVIAIGIAAADRTGAPNHCGLGGWAHSRQHSDQFV